MAILDRLSTLLRANVHAAIDKAEDPEKLLDQLIRDAESGRRAGQQQLMTIVSERNRIAAEATHEEKLARKALAQAETAVRQGNDDQAREALRRRHDAVEAANLYAQQAESQQLIVERLKTQLSQMDAKLRRMRQERDSLVARKRVADAQIAVSASARQVAGFDLDGEYVRLSRSVRQSEAMAAASLEMYVDTLEGRLDALEDEQIETQLLSIKERTRSSADLSADPLLLALQADSAQDFEDETQG